MTAKKKKKNGFVRRVLSKKSSSLASSTTFFFRTLFSQETKRELLLTLVDVAHKGIVELHDLLHHVIRRLGGCLPVRKNVERCEQPLRQTRVLCDLIPHLLPERLLWCHVFFFFFALVFVRVSVCLSVYRFVRMRCILFVAAVTAALMSCISWSWCQTLRWVTDDEDEWRRERDGLEWREKGEMCANALKYIHVCVCVLSQLCATKDHKNQEQGTLPSSQESRIEQGKHALFCSSFKQKKTMATNKNHWTKRGLLRQKLKSF